MHSDNDKYLDIMTRIYEFKCTRIQEHLAQSRAQYQKCLEDRFAACVKAFERDIMEIVYSVEKPPKTVVNFALTIRDDFKNELTATIQPPSIRLKNIRKKRALTLTALSEKTGVAKSNLSKYENGSRMLTSEMAKRLSKELDVAPNYLLRDCFPVQ